ncbi:hypothetical protein P7K49_031254 [Saguinus oedipus]|uniref:Uncharacterized protein n=1 Tax=Saguinus oedipus TaxID=9490 RepID=A0ABQ9TYW6_SAGOE|nr:hypothetical protein P7K49_031254 [Saguinus oedipus]
MKTQKCDASVHGPDHEESSRHRGQLGLQVVVKANLFSVKSEKAFMQPKTLGLGPAASRLVLRSHWEEEEMEWRFGSSDLGIYSQNEYIANLKDQLQEMKAKTNLENRYMQINTELQIAQTQKKCNRTEELLLEEIEKLRMKTEEETRVHMEIEMFLRKEQQKLEEKLEFWMEKYDKDTEMKQNELNALKAAKASDLAHLQDLAKTVRKSPGHSLHSE